MSRTHEQTVRRHIPRRTRVGTGTALATLSLLLATGCSGGEPVVGKDEVAAQASAALEERVGQAPDDLTCAEDLPAKVGASIRCELTAGGRTYGVTITTTSAEGNNAEFDILVDDEPTQ
ncbi:DUF4333 domain-containing protein [Streptomyces xiamenensis]